MRNIFTLLLCIILPVFSLNAQSGRVTYEDIGEGNVPIAVQESQLNSFPESFVTRWHLQREPFTKVNDTVFYRSSFQQNSVPGHKATYLTNGFLLYSSQFMRKNQLPQTIFLKIKQDHPDFVVEHANFITLYRSKFELYSIRLQEDNRFLDVYYDINGNKIEKDALPAEIVLFSK